MQTQLSRWLWTTFGCAALTLPVYAQETTEWEWEPDEGYHEEEWYDPSDWFNDDSYTSYESDWNDYDYDDDYYGWGYYEPYYDPYVSTDFDPWYDYDYDADDWYYDDGSDYVYLQDDDWVWDSRQDRWVQWTDYRGNLDQGRQSGQNARTAQGSQNRGNRQGDGGQQTRSGDRDRQDQGTDRYTSGRIQAQRRQSQRGGMAGDGGKHQQKTISGQLEAFTEVNLKGQQDSHTVVRVRLEDGTTKLVNLGPGGSLQKFELERGKKVTIRGRAGQINDVPVLMATMVKSGDQTMRRGGGGQQSRQQGQQARAGDQRGSGSNQKTIRGDIEDWRKLSMDLDGRRSEHLFVRLKLESGDTVVANFGPNTDLQQLDLESGDRIVIRGMQRDVNGRDVLFARDVRLEHEPVSLDWNQRGRSRSGSSGQVEQAAGPGR